MPLSADATRELQRYINADLSNAELEAWLAGLEYDPDVSTEERDALAQVRLVLTEVEENRRRAEDVLVSVATVLATFEPARTITAARTGSATTWAGDTPLTATPSRLQRVGI
jgi:hypothetical protein